MPLTNCVNTTCTDDKVYALDENTGDELWTFTTGGFDIDFGEASPAIADGKVFVGSVDDKLYALNQLTGDKRPDERTA